MGDPCTPYAALGRWTFQLEYAMSNQVPPGFSRLESFCSLRAEKFPDVRESLVLSRDTNYSLLNGDTSCTDIRAVFLACFEGLLNRVPHCIDVAD